MRYGRCLSERSPRRAAAAAELAMLLPLLAVLLVGLCDFARVFFYSLTITSCARNGALYGSIDTTHSTNTSGIQQYAVNDGASLNPALTTSNVSVKSSNFPSNSANYCKPDANGHPIVQVTVNYSFNLIIKNYPGFSSPVSISQMVEMRVTPATAQ